MQSFALWWKGCIELRKLCALRSCKVKKIIDNQFTEYFLLSDCRPRIKRGCLVQVMNCIQYLKLFRRYWIVSCHAPHAVLLKYSNLLEIFTPVQDTSDKGMALLKNGTDTAKSRKVINPMSLLCSLAWQFALLLHIVLCKFPHPWDDILNLYFIYLSKQSPAGAQWHLTS